jgi:hypothetical protein
VLRAPQRQHARRAQVDALQSQQREEQPSLAASDGPTQTAGAGRDLPSREHEYAVADVGVVIFLVRIGMVPVMFSDPPAIAQANQQVAEHLAEAVVGAATGEHLLVPGVMAEERDLGEGDTQHHRGDGLKPRVTDPHHARPGRDIERQREPDPNRVRAWASIEQSGVADTPGEHCVVAAPARYRMGDGRGAHRQPSTAARGLGAVIVDRRWVSSSRGRTTRRRRTLT